jgi:hypothetical protein
MPDFKNIKEKMDSNITRIAIIVGVIILFIAIYSMFQIARRDKNCSRIKEYKGERNIRSIDITDKTTKLIDVYVKTAYNCCCSGDFNNDYVDTCALSFCADQGVRALHFDIYSLNNRPVIATSSVKGNSYKETYNSLDMYTTMDMVKNKFMTNSDPLFLIFCVNSKISNTYESMYAILVELFGTGNKSGNMILLSNDIGNMPLVNLINKVVICVEAIDKPAFYASSLALITSLDLNGASRIYRETDILDLYNSRQTPNEYIPPYPQVLFPNKQKSSNNYDFVTTGVQYGINFIGMSFQTGDNILSIYNKGFSNSKSAFIKRGPIVTNVITPPDIKNYYSIKTFGIVPR